MGKTFKDFHKSKERNNMLEFEVLVRVHGKRPHTEKYGIPINQVKMAKALGYIDESEKNKTYYDWKPLFLNVKEFPGGIFEVNHYTFDEKYAYAHLSEKGNAEFSLPKYLFEKIGFKQMIMVGKRLGK